MNGQITGETIKSAIARKLSNSTFTALESFKLYKEMTRQNFSLPAFFIWTVNVEQTKEAKNRFRLNYSMEVRFHPNTRDPVSYEKLCSVGTELLDYLETIYVPIMDVGPDGAMIEIVRPVRGKQMEFKIVEDVLQFLVDYSIRAARPLEEIPDMQTLEINDMSKEAK